MFPCRKQRSTHLVAATATRVWVGWIDTSTTTEDFAIIALASAGRALLIRRALPLCQQSVHLPRVMKHAPCSSSFRRCWDQLDQHTYYHKRSFLHRIDTSQQSISDPQHTTIWSGNPDPDQDSQGLAKLTLFVQLPQVFGSVESTHLLLQKS